MHARLPSCSWNLRRPSDMGQLAALAAPGAGVADVRHSLFLLLLISVVQPGSSHGSNGNFLLPMLDSVVVQVDDSCNHC
jgi:hypothetical protein